MDREEYRFECWFTFYWVTLYIPIGSPIYYMQLNMNIDSWQKICGSIPKGHGFKTNRIHVIEYTFLSAEKKIWTQQIEK